MKKLGFAALLILIAAGAHGQPPRKKRLLCIGATQGFQHDSVPYAMATLWQLGKESGLWETYIKTDTQWITKKKLEKNAKNLNDFDAVYFFTTGELPMDNEQKAALLSFVKDDGKGFIGGHSATDTFFEWPEYGQMVGGYFDEHPWMTWDATVKIDDPQFPGMAQFGPAFLIHDEIYQIRNFHRDQVHMLMSLDLAKADMNNPRVRRDYFPIAWEKNYGNGRVFMCSLGHPNETYDRPDMRIMYLESVKWAMGLTR